MCNRVFFAVTVTVLCAVSTAVPAQDFGWYTEGNFAPGTRIELTLVNTLDFDRTNCPIVITRDSMPMPNLHEMWVTVVDPNLPPRPEPSKEVLRQQGGHNIRAETNGQQLYYQLDDLDKDGVWDELFFMTDIKARERKPMHIYIGFSQRGWMEHGTHAAIGSYCRHLIPFWESANVGWKLWYPTSVDVFGKRVPGLMSNELYMKNINGYGVKYDYGSDIMRVAWSFGGGGIGVFEVPSIPDSVSVPRFAKPLVGKMSPANWNEGQFDDTRYAFEVVVNGPVRSMIKAKTMNWNARGGMYEAEQYYTAYTNQSYSTCRVKFTEFLPLDPGAAFCCGIRKNAREFDSYHEGGIAMTLGKDELSDPDDDTGLSKLIVEFVGNALVVKDEYAPEYVFVPGFEGNYTFKVPATDDRTFEYMIFAAWSEGAVYKTPESFKEYVLQTTKEYNNPVQAEFGRIETR